MRRLYCPKGAWACRRLDVTGTLDDQPDRDSDSRELDPLPADRSYGPLRYSAETAEFRHHVVSLFFEMPSRLQVLEEWPLPPYTFADDLQLGISRLSARGKQHEAVAQLATDVRADEFVNR